MVLLEFNKVGFKNVLKDISFSVEKGEFITVVGPSGGGKSTVFKLCSDLISCSQGEIKYKDVALEEYDPRSIRKEIGYCCQLVFGDVVIDNLRFPYEVRNQNVSEDRILELFELFNLKEELLNSQVKNLSSGEKQRISLVRTLLFEPEILLLDEITSALDKENAELVENVVKKLNEKGMTIMWITHNPEQSRRYANKIITIEAGSIKNMEVLR